MQILFQNPALFGLLALAALPLLVHLLSRTKPPTYQFSNIEFLRKVQRFTSRLRRPKDWLLWLLRTLALLFLFAAFLSPLLISDSAPLPGEKRTVVCLVDRSGSMGASDGATSRFDRACAAAAEVLDVAKPDLANVIWIDAQPDPVFPEPGPNRAFLTDELSGAGVSSEPNAIEAAFDLALRQFADSVGRRELHVISDFQASAWKDIGSLVPDVVDLHLIPVAEDPLSNMAVSSLVAVPAAPVAGRELLVKCRVDNHSIDARRVSLTLDAGGSRQSQMVDLPARGSAEATFRIQCDAPGLLPLTAEIDGNDFTADNRRFAVVRVRESLRMVVAGDAEGAPVASMMRLAASLPWLEALPMDDFKNLPTCDVLVVPDWRGEAAGRLREAADLGTTVLIFATSATHQGVHTLFNSTSAGERSDTPLAMQPNDSGWEVAPVAEHPTYGLFVAGEFGNPFAGRFRQRLRLPETPGTEELAYYSDRHVAVLAATDVPLILANLPLNPKLSTWTGEPAFLMTVAEWILHFRKSGGRESFVAEPASPISWVATEEVGMPVLRTASGSSMPLVSQQTAEGTRWQSTGGVGAGLYSWVVSGQPVHYTAVNFPPSESSLDPMNQPPTTLGASATTMNAANLAELGGGLELWPSLIAAALFCLFLETLIVGFAPKFKTS